MGEPNDIEDEWEWDGTCTRCYAILGECEENPPQTEREAVCYACDARIAREEVFALGCIVGAAIVAWGDAMRKREEAKQRAKDWEDRKLEEDMG